PAHRGGVLELRAEELRHDLAGPVGAGGDRAVPERRNRLRAAVERRQGGGVEDDELLLDAEGRRRVGRAASIRRLRCDRRAHLRPFRSTTAPAIAPATATPAAHAAPGCRRGQVLTLTRRPGRGRPPRTAPVASEASRLPSGRSGGSSMTTHPGPHRPKTASAMPGATRCGGTGSRPPPPPWSARTGRSAAYPMQAAAIAAS